MLAIAILLGLSYDAMCTGVTGHHDKNLVFLLENF